jgi:SAM-dependent methyltransferase
MTDALPPIRSLPTELFIYDYAGAHDPLTYELENRIADPDGRIEAFMDRVAPMDGRVVADIGAGGGFHAVRYAKRAAHVYAIEPAPQMLIQLHRRVAGEPDAIISKVSVLAAGAEALPLPNASVDIIHSRFSYFFGPENTATGTRTCEPGIHEALRVLRPGGHVFIIDNDHREGDWATFLREFGYAGEPGYADRLDAFWSAHGFSAATVMSEWRAPSRKALERVIGMEFGDRAAAVMNRIDGASLRYGYRIYHRGA